VENEPELNLLLTDWGQDRSRTREARLLSVAVHVLAVTALVVMPRSLVSPSPRVQPLVTPLIEPQSELTQKAPNKGKINKELTAEALEPRPRIRIPPSPPSSTRPPAPKNTPAQAPPPAPLPEPPRIDTSSREILPPRALPPGPEVSAAAPPQIQPDEKPRITLETPTARPPSGGKGRIAIPDTSVSGAIKSLARQGSEGALTVGDDSSDASFGGLGPGLRLPPSPGRPGSALQLLSDPMGVDFRPYLMQVLANVRRNWSAIYPESAKLGARGKVQIQFAIARDGSIPKEVKVAASGIAALDRAAVSAISMSEPLPPLPTEYAGSVIRLQFTFLYNVPRK